MENSQPLLPDQMVINKPEQRSNTPGSECLDVVMVCPDCQENPPTLIEEFAHGEIVCGSCGRVLEDHVLDTGKEWCDFSNDYDVQEDYSRVGSVANPLFFGSQLQTEIAVFARNAKFSKSDRVLAHTQKKMNKDSEVERTNHKLAIVYNNINNLCQSGGLQKIVQDQACLLYKLIFHLVKIQVCPQDAVIASVIILACRANGHNRTIEDICKLAGTDRKGMRRTFPKVRDEIKKAATSSRSQDPMTTMDSELMVSTADSVKIVARICSQLNITGRLQIQCEKAAEKEVQHALAEGKQPQTRAAACILLVCRELGKPLDEKQLARYAGVTVQTIKKSYDDTITPAAHLLIDPSWRNE